MAPGHFTLVEANDTLCFHLADIYCGKFLSQYWLQLIAITLCRQARIHVLGRLTYVPEAPITALEALAIVHDWSCINMGDRPLRRTVWEERRAIFEHLTPLTIDTNDHPGGKWLITQPKTRPNYVPWITYSNTDILRATGTIVLCCPADLLSYSATTRFIIREYGQEHIFRLKPSVGTALRLAHSPLPLGTTKFFSYAPGLPTNFHYYMAPYTYVSPTSSINSINTISHIFTYLFTTRNDRSIYCRLGTPCSATTSRIKTSIYLSTVVFTSPSHPYFPKIDGPDAHLSSLRFHVTY